MDDQNKQPVPPENVNPQTNNPLSENLDSRQPQNNLLNQDSSKMVAKGKRPRQHKKLFNVLAAVVIVLLLGLLAIPTSIVISCHNSENTVQKDSTEFVKQFKNLQVNGNYPNNVTGYFNRDCVDGLGSVAVTSIYNISPVTVSKINDEVLNTLNTNTFASKPFLSIVTSHSINDPTPPNGTVIYDVESDFYNKSGTSYTIDYQLENPAICQIYNNVDDVSSPYCINNGYIATNYNLYNQVANKVTVQATIPTNK